MVNTTKWAIKDITVSKVSAESVERTRLVTKKYNIIFRIGIFAQIKDNLQIP